MPYHATIAIDGHEPFELLHVDYEISAALNSHNRPIRRPLPSLINLVVAVGNSNVLSSQVWLWCELRQVKSAEIVFYRQDNAAALKSISFNNAHCVKYREVFDANSAEPVKIFFTLSAQSMYASLGSGYIEAIWSDAETAGSPPPSSASSAPESGDGSVSTFDAS